MAAVMENWGLERVWGQLKGSEVNSKMGPGSVHKQSSEMQWGCTPARQGLFCVCGLVTFPMLNGNST